jgi:predicted membrane protein
MLFPFILLCVAIRKIWPDNRQITGIIIYGFAIISTILLAGDAIYSEEVVDTIIIGLSAAIMLMIAFGIKSKRWFTLSTAVLVFLGIYMSREFWLNLAWWIYLLAVGLSLIIFAAINEKQKQRGKSLKNKVAGLMSDWEW